MNTLNINKICYILNAFPMPSETFISDEITSMFDLEFSSYVLFLREGDRTIVHPSARRIIDSNRIQAINSKSKLVALIYVFRLFLKRPLNTMSVFLKSMRASDRWRYFQAVPYALDLIKKNVQFIHVHFADQNLQLAKILSEWSGIPFGVTTHRYDLLNDPIPVLEASKLFLAADLVVTISEYNKALMLEKYSIPAEKIKVIHCGIDAERFKPDQRYEKFNDSKLRIINIGRLVHQKGQDILLHALAEVKNRGVIFDLKIIGAGPLLDDLKELASSLDIADQVHFLGAQSQDTIIEMLSNSDLFILSSRSEGLPVVCMEAMAMEVFLIATRISGIPELVSNIENGLLVEPENVHELADAVCWADQNREALKEMTKAARETVEKDFNRKKCTNMLISEMNIACCSTTHNA